MNNNALPTQSNTTLIKATASAVVIAGLVLVTVILPAEYNIDPTGLGKTLGLTQLTQTSAQTQPSAPTSNNVDDAMSTPKSESTALAFQKNTATIVVPAGKGVEYKFYLKQYGALKYKWSTSSVDAQNNALYFDFHGEPEGDTTGYFQSFTIATSNEMEGTLTTPFAGSHGWYWRNYTDKPITVNLSTEGNYTVTGLKQ